jgi:hypothetical protein
MGGPRLRGGYAEQALTLARQFYESQPSDLYFETFDGGMPLNEIAIQDAGGADCASWLSQEFRLCLAAQDLLAGLEQAVVALNSAPRFLVPSLATDSYWIAAICDLAIAKAKGGVQ